MKKIKIINESYETFIEVEFYNCLIEEAFESALKLSKKKKKNVLYRFNGVNLKFTPSSTIEEITEYYKTTKEVVRNNNLNSLEFQRALELSMVKK